MRRNLGSHQLFVQPLPIALISQAQKSVACPKTLIDLAVGHYHSPPNSLKRNRASGAAHFMLPTPNSVFICCKPRLVVYKMLNFPPAWGRITSSFFECPGAPFNQGVPGFLVPLL
jgi:hypothetical protein